MANEIIYDMAFWSKSPNSAMLYTVDWEIFMLKWCCMIFLRLLIFLLMS